MKPNYENYLYLLGMFLAFCAGGIIGLVLFHLVWKVLENLTDDDLDL